MPSSGIEEHRVGRLEPASRRVLAAPAGFHRAVQPGPGRLIVRAGRTASRRKDRRRLRPEPPHPRARDAITAFVRAFGRRHTYDPRRNAYSRFGFLWGLPVPTFSIGLDLQLSRTTGLTPLAVLLEHPFHLFFLAHPLLFGLVFGAMGTVRRDLEVEKDRLIATLTDLAITDPLTQLYNRRYALEALQNGLSRAARTREPLAVALLDLDGFKAVNELRGHPAADRVLCDVAFALRSVLRRSEVIGRYGGDEFLLVMTIDIERAARVVGRAGRAVRRSTGLTVSTGIARCPEDGESAEALLAAADARLADAKEAKRGARKGTLGGLH